MGVALVKKCTMSYSQRGEQGNAVLAIDFTAVRILLTRKSVSVLKVCVPCGYKRRLAYKNFGLKQLRFITKVLECQSLSKVLTLYINQTLFKCLITAWHAQF